VGNVLIRLNRFQRGLVHLWKGTLIGRLRWGWYQYVRKMRRKWWKSQCGKQEYVEAEIQPGVRIKLYFDSWLCCWIYHKECDRAELQFLNAFLRPGDIFVDIGANIGLYTVTAAHLVRETGHVYAFEPCSKNFKRLVDNVQANNFRNVSCYQLALSDKTQIEEMTISLDGYDASNSLAKPVLGEYFGTESVSCIKWDDFLREHGVARCARIIKIDVEGWENYVISGAKETLSGRDAPILQVEFNERACRSAGSSCRELFQLLESLGYKIFSYDSHRGMLFAEIIRPNYWCLNLIACKKPEFINKRLRESFSV
jgi:FkbM family methyltransferase